MASSGQQPLPQRFFSFFQHEITELQEQIDRLADLPTVGGERSDAAEHCLAAISRLSTEVKEASSYLPPYDQRTYSAAIKALQEKLQETKAAFAPKPKFSFKARKSPSAISLSDAAELAAQKRKAAWPGYHHHHSPSSTNTPNTGTPFSSTTPPLPDSLQDPANESTGVQPPAAAAAAAAAAQKEPPPPAPAAAQQQSRPRLSTSSTSITISNQTSSHIILPATSVSPTPPVTLSHLTSCVVNLLPPTPSTTTTSTTTTPSTERTAFPSLTLTHTTTSLLLLGHIAGPTHMTGLSASTILLSTHQLRIHNSTNLRIYLHCTSRPIIEHSSGIVFSPLPAAYASRLPLPSLSATSTADSSTQSWHQEVDDFQWLKATPSPNWRVDRSTKVFAHDDDDGGDGDETWRHIIDGGDGGGGSGSGSWSVPDILAAVGIK